MINLFLTLLLFPAYSEAKTVRYELTATEGKINLSGKKEVDFALFINGSIPSPTLEFTEGDEAEILVKNELNEELSIHWHGILLPPIMDGVAYVTTPPILAGKNFLFKFPIRQHGTYWYHSHTMLQEQKGVYGGIVIHPKKKTIAYDRDLTLVISDWTDENPDQVMRNLRKDGDYYLYKKGTMRSWLGALQNGGLKTYLGDEWSRMGGMDLSDVGYDAFLLNGKRELFFPELKAGERIRLRLINAAASSYFYVALGNAPMRVIAADGIDIEPIDAKEILMGMAETYDILYTVPKDQSAELRVTVQDITGHASAWLGKGEKIAAPDKPAPNLYAPMSHGGHDMASMDHSKMDHSAMDHSKMDHSKMDHSKMDHSQHKKKPRLVDQLVVDELRAPAPTTLPEGKIHEVKLELDGDMERYVWFINGKAIHEDRDILIRENERVRFVFVNNTMMHHPMHLHGHFFRVINAGKEKSPLKHTVDVPPHSTRTIEFFSNEPGEWMLHCHNLYHMKTGMARVVKYEKFKTPEELIHWQHHDPHKHDHIYFAGALQAASNQAETRLRAINTRGEIELRAESTREKNTGKWELEGDLLYRRWFGTYLNLMAGGTSFHEHQRAMIGLGYLLPMLIESAIFIDQKAILRLDFEKKFQWTSTIFTEMELRLRRHEKPEWKVNLMYGPSWHWAIGVNLNQEMLGAGVQLQF
jgi:FtsP/CotA-like multicopper oxidase with cupredoxin domain